MFRVPTDIKAGKAITINGQAYAKDERIQADDLATIAKRLHVFMSRGLLYASPDPHARRVGFRKRQPTYLPAVMLNATLAQEVVQDAPAAPTAASAAYASPTSVTVSFTPGAAGTSAITNYEYKVGTGAWTALSPVDTSSPITVPVGADSSGNLRIRAVSSVGKGTQSDAIAYSTLLPAAPTALIATPGSSQASIAFTAGAAGAQAITTYQYQVNAGAWTTRSTGTTGSPVVITGLTPAVQVAIKLRAVSAVGNGAESAPVNVTPTA